MNICQICFATALLFITHVVNASDAKFTTHLQAGFVIGTSYVSGDPMDTKASAEGGNAIHLILGKQNSPIEFTIGMQQQDYGHLSLEDIDLGDGPSLTVITSTVRYSFEKGKLPFTPYAGLGIHQSSYAKSTLFDGLVTLKSANKTDALMEVGARSASFGPWDNMYVDLNVSKKFGEARADMVTTTGDAGITTIMYESKPQVMLSIGIVF